LPRGREERRGSNRTHTGVAGDESNRIRTLSRCGDAPMGGCPPRRDASAKPEAAPRVLFHFSNSLEDGFQYRKSGDRVWRPAQATVLGGSTVPWKSATPERVGPGKRRTRVSTGSREREPLRRPGGRENQRHVPRSHCNMRPGAESGEDFVGDEQHVTWLGGQAPDAGKNSSGWTIIPPAPCNAAQTMTAAISWPRSTRGVGFSRHSMWHVARSPATGQCAQ